MPDGFRLAGLDRTPFGRGRVKLEWEVKRRGQFLDGSGTGISSFWLDTDTAGVALDEIVSNLEPGDYHWRMRLLYDPATSPFAQTSRWFTVPWSGQEEADLSLATSIGGIVWEDRNRNGLRDGWEPRMGAVTVYLLDSGGSTVDLTSTDSAGFYRFEVSDSATYLLRFSIPAGYLLTVPDQKADDTLDSDPNRVTGETVLMGPPFLAFDPAGWSAGYVSDGPCIAPDELR